MFRFIYTTKITLFFITSKFLRNFFQKNNYFFDLLVISLSHYKDNTFFDNFQIFEKLFSKIIIII